VNFGKQQNYWGNKINLLVVSPLKRYNGEKYLVESLTFYTTFEW